MDSLLVGSRVRCGNRWATVAAVRGDLVSLVFEGEAAIIQMPQHACTMDGMATVAEHARAVQRRRDWVEISARARPVADAPEPQRMRQGTSREHRPRQARRTVRAGASRDGPQRSGDDDPSPELELDRLRGFQVANLRLYVHEARRLAARRVA
jgi:hypothetical protein